MRSEGPALSSVRFADARRRLVAEGNQLVFERGRYKRRRRGVSYTIVKKKTASREVEKQERREDKTWQARRRKTRCRYDEKEKKRASESRKAAGRKTETNEWKARLAQYNERWNREKGVQRREGEGVLDGKRQSCQKPITVIKDVSGFVSNRKREGEEQKER